jgi:hypothetical protein
MEKNYTGDKIMRICSIESKRSTYACPEDVLFQQEERLDVPRRPEITALTDESFNLIVIPSFKILEPEMEIAEWQTMKFVALKEIQDVAGGRLTHWREENHLGEKSLFETFEREQG